MESLVGCVAGTKTDNATSPMFAQTNYVAKAMASSARP